MTGAMYLIMTMYRPFLPNFSPFLVASPMTVSGPTSQPTRMQVPIATTGMRTLLLT